MFGQTAEDDATFLGVGAAAQAVADRHGLLKNFLEHVMVVIAEPVGFELVFKLADDGADFGVVDGAGSETVGMEDGHFIVVEIDHAGGVLDDGAGIGSDDVFVLANADDEGTAPSRHDEGFGLILADDGDAVGSFDLMQRRLHGVLKERSAVGQVIFGFQLGVEIADQDGQDFGVGLAGEGMSLFGEELLEGDVVFDHAVVNQGDQPAVIGVRMGIDLRGGAVRSPARVGHAQVGLGKGLAMAQGVFQNADPADGPTNVQLMLIVDDGDSG